jgi:hypothetical protein
VSQKLVAKEGRLVSGWRASSRSENGDSVDRRGANPAQLPGYRIGVIGVGKTLNSRLGLTRTFFFYQTRDT